MKLLSNFFSHKIKGKDYSYSSGALSNLLKKLGNEPNPLRQSCTYSLIGSIYLRESQLDEALEFKMQALMTRKESTDFIFIAESYNDVGVVYQQMNSYQYALSYYKESWRWLIKSQSDPLYLPQQYILYKNLGSLYYAIKEWVKSKNFLMKAKEVVVHCFGKKEIAQLNYNLALVLIHQKNMNLAHEYFGLAARGYASLKKEEEMLALCKKRMADIHFIKKEYEEAKFLYQESQHALIENFPSESSYAISQIKKIDLNIKYSYWNRLKSSR